MNDARTEAVLRTVLGKLGGVLVKLERYLDLKIAEMEKGKDDGPSS